MIINCYSSKFYKISATREWKEADLRERWNFRGTYVDALVFAQINFTRKKFIIETEVAINVSGEGPWRNKIAGFSNDNIY